MAEPINTPTEQRVAFTPEALTAFGQGTSADAAACNAYVCTALAVGDRLAGAATLLGADGAWRVDTRTEGGQTVREVGRYFSDVEWKANDPFTPGLTEDQRKARLATMALRGTLDQLAAARGLPAVELRDAGAWFALPLAALIVVVGLAAGYVGARAVETSAETRQLQLRIAGAADAFAARMGEQRRTGQPIAPSELETVGWPALEAQGRSTWDSVKETAMTAGKTLLIAGAIGFGIWLWSQSKSKKD